MRSILLGLVTLPVMVMSCQVVFALDMVMPGSSMHSLKNQVAIMAERANRAQEQAKSSMSLLRMRLAAKLAASEETLARQVEILSNYQEQLNETTGANASDPQRVRLEALMRQVRSDVVSQLELLKELLKKLQELREKMAGESDLDTTPTVVTGTSDTSPSTETTITPTETTTTTPSTSPGGS
ncbi:MAG: hypothetical protein AB1646_10025 [Thermodesulfobacteriota bacterium]